MLGAGARRRTPGPRVRRRRRDLESERRCRRTRVTCSIRTASRRRAPRSRGRQLADAHAACPTATARQLRRPSLRQRTTGWIPGIPTRPTYTVDVAARSGPQLRHRRPAPRSRCSIRRSRGTGGRRRERRLQRRQPASGSARDYARPADSDPAADDRDWSDWRREQITALMRRIYLNVDRHQAAA